MNTGAKKEQQRKTSIKLPPLSRAFVIRYRSSPFQSICFDTLEMGMHETFTELLKLTNLQEQRRLAAGPESDEWTAPQLRDQVQKLQLIRDCLVEVEIARLSADYDAVFRGYLHLIRELSRKTGANNEEEEEEEAGKWLVEYFLEKCLQSSREVTLFLETMVTKEGQVESDEAQERLDLAKQRAAEALFHVANLAFNDGKYEEAIEMYRQLYTSTQGTIWITPTDRPKEDTPNQDRIQELLRQLGQLNASVSSENSPYLHITAAEKLSASLLCLAEYIEPNMDEKTCDYKLSLLTEACALAKEGFILDAEGASYTRVDLVYCGFLLPCRLGCLQESIQCLQNLKRLALNCNDARALVEAEISLGRVYSRKPYCEGKAKRHCAEAFRVSLALGDDAVIRRAGVWQAISQAHHRMAEYTSLIRAENDDEALSRLLEWKSRRDNFVKRPISQSPVTPVT
ncbi:unnamed protein product [Schistocephalus solidus]|uniref:Tetratricopeptide repeat protein 29 n=1 Tax=Schistocephalus solidus TaxID=70667 RepID=A0A183SLK9_SCHSO|nr:unnamed protein product [Schistocephalus solidus]